METTVEVDEKRRRLRAEIARLEAEVEALAALPEQDVFPDGTIVRCDLSGSRGKHTYVFLKIVVQKDVHEVTGSGRLRTYAEELWYFTGSLGGDVERWRRAVRWGDLVSFLTTRGRTVERWDVLWPQDIATQPVNVIVETSDDLRPGNYTFQLGADGLYR